jgi:hypothetical protein
MVQFVSLVFKISATELVSVGIELISSALAEECRKILETMSRNEKREVELVGGGQNLGFDGENNCEHRHDYLQTSLKMFPYARLSTQNAFRNFAGTTD